MNSSRSLTEARTGAAFYAWLRDRWTAGLALHSDVALILVVSAAWAVLYNLQFWHLSIAAMWHPTPGAALFLASLFVVIVCPNPSRGWKNDEPGRLGLMRGTPKSLRRSRPSRSVIPALA